MKKIYFLILLAFTVSYAQKPDCIPDLFYQGGMHMADYYMTSCFFPNLMATNTIDIDVDGNFVKSPLLSLTTTGTGAATYNTTNRVLNLPTGLFAEVDGSTSNELQTLSYNTGNGSLSISGGNSVTLPGSMTKTFNNTPGRSLVTTAAAANGFQISSTRDASVSYSTSISTSVSLSGNSSGYVVLEICPTNSAVAGNWIEINRFTSGQSGTLVVGLILNQVGGGTVSGMVPAGYYARLRSVNVSGTPTYTTNGQQEVY